MKLAQLIADLEVHNFLEANAEISFVTSDSRRVASGALFVAYAGLAKDGHDFIHDAVTRGAAAIVGEHPAPPGLTVPYVQVADGRAALAWLSASWHSHPSRAMALVGITGTDGKTTTANILYEILRAAGRRTGLISTVNAVIGDSTIDTGLHTTTPDAPDVQAYLARMRAAGTQVAVLEATSHGLAQRRVTGCAFDVAVITNITHEHLDFHGSYEAYREAKALLFRSLSTSPGKALADYPSGLPRTAVLNRDDGSCTVLAGIPAQRRITYGLEPDEEMVNSDVALTARQIRQHAAGLSFDVHVLHRVPWSQLAPWRATPEHWHIASPLLGGHNVSNILAATGAALALGTDVTAIQEGVHAIAQIPGRAERISLGQDFTLLIDFAHTPHALRQILQMARGMVQAGGRVLVVFGSAGLRDCAKRRLMGAVAAELADFTVITAEDPRAEDLTAIMAETAGALSDAGRIEGRDFVRVADRQRAICEAVRRARGGDVVIVAGKGHERSMCFGVTEYPWQDQAAARWALEALQGRASAQPPFVLPTW